MIAAMPEGAPLSRSRTMVTSTEGPRALAVPGYLTGNLIRAALDRLTPPAATIAAAEQSADAGTATPAQPGPQQAGRMSFAHGRGSLGLAFGGVFGSDDGDSGLAGMDYRGWSAGVTGNYHLNDTVSVGADIGYGRLAADLDGNAGNVDVESWLFGLHGGLRRGRG